MFWSVFCFLTYLFTSSSQKLEGYVSISLETLQHSCSALSSCPPAKLWTLKASWKTLHSILKVALNLFMSFVDKYSSPIVLLAFNLWLSCNHDQHICGFLIFMKTFWSLKWIPFNGISHKLFTPQWFFIEISMSNLYENTVAFPPVSSFHIYLTHNQPHLLLQLPKESMLMRAHVTHHVRFKNTYP